IVAFNVAMRVAMIIQVVTKMIRAGLAVMAMFRAWASLATVAQWLFNGSLLACPITWIALGIAALIVIIILLAKNWDKVSAAIKAAGKWIADTFRLVRDWIYKALDNPIIRAAALIFAPFITIPILIAKNWGAIVGLFKEIWTVVSTFANGLMSTVIPYVRALGETFLKYLLLPINLVFTGIVELMNLLGRLPGKIGDPFRAAAAAVGGFQSSMNKMLTGTSGALDFGGIWQGVGQNEKPPGVPGGASNPSTRTAESRSYKETVNRSEVFVRPDRDTIISRTPGGRAEPSLAMGTQ
ncbi:MAG: hypothetical protein IMZ54_13200, partial [Acidobacteria bacterium]|nr:hypothetical protein [Acidobacteriota bacterium]